MQTYSVLELAAIAGISKRTLHYYDEIGLLKPAIRTQGKYRYYGEQQCLKLQQILLYKALGFKLSKIKEILMDPGFELLDALNEHKKALVQKQQKIKVLINTIDKTINNLKTKKMISKEELYEGFSTQEAREMRDEAKKEFGEEEVRRSEYYLTKLTKSEFEDLKKEQHRIFSDLFKRRAEDPRSREVQLLIAKHFNNTMQFWGKLAPNKEDWKAYKGLGELYVNDERFTMMEGIAQPEFARFMKEAMILYVRMLTC